MNKLFKILPLLALVLGVSLAAANVPLRPAHAVDVKKALNSSNQWINITGQVQGTHYRCEAEDRICTQLFDSMGNPIPDTEVEGRYLPLP